MLKSSFKILAVIMLLVATAFGEDSFPKEIGNTEISIAEGLKEENQEETFGITRLVPVPHILCTGFSISGLLETCFPPGCICAKGAGICDLTNKCVRVQLSINWNKELQVDIDKPDKQEE